jgi:hypothetical protein
VTGDYYQVGGKGGDGILVLGVHVVGGWCVCVCSQEREEQDECGIAIRILHAPPPNSLYLSLEYKKYYTMWRRGII